MKPIKNDNKECECPPPFCEFKEWEPTIADVKNVWYGRALFSLAKRISRCRRMFTKKHVHETRKNPASNISVGKGLPVIKSSQVFHEIYRCSDDLYFVPTKMVFTNRSDIDTGLHIVDMDMVDDEVGSLVSTYVHCKANATLYLDEKHIATYILPFGQHSFKYGICGRASVDMDEGVSVFVEGYEIKNNGDQ